MTELSGYLKAQTAGRAVWVDNGETFACISTRGGSPQVWERAVSGGAWRQRSFGNERIGFEGSTTINRKDFGITWNAALETGGVLVGEKVTLEFDVSAIKQA